MSKPESGTDTAPPMHGYRGDTAKQILDKPQGMTVAISREAGARGGTLAAAVGQRLNWPVFDHDLLDHLVRDELARKELLNDVPEGALAWADATLAKLGQTHMLAAGPGATDTARLLLAIAARGSCVLVGRGAGYLLPAATTIHVRVVAPVEERVAYFGQWSRLSRTEAVAEVNRRDQHRHSYLKSLLGRDPEEHAEYDIVLNSSRLGLDACTMLVLDAVQAKQTSMDESSTPDAFEPA